MALARKDFVFFTFPFSLILLGVSTRTITENPSDSFDTQGLTAVAIYFVVLLVLAFMALCLALAGRLLHRSKMKTNCVVRWLCFAPLFLVSGSISLVSAGFVISSASGLAAFLLSLLSMVGAVLFIKKDS